MKGHTTLFLVSLKIRKIWNDRLLSIPFMQFKTLPNFYSKIPDILLLAHSALSDITRGMRWLTWTLHITLRTLHGICISPQHGLSNTLFSPPAVTPATARQLRTHIIKEIKHWVSTADTKSPFIKYFQLAITFISGHDHNFEVMMKLVRKKHSSSDCGKAVRPSEWWEGQSRVLRRDWNVKMVWIRACPQI